jgi:hypothetical protein
VFTHEMKSLESTVVEQRSLEGIPGHGRIAMASQRSFTFAEIRKAFVRADRLSGMLQGTMSLEGQGRDKATIRRLRRRMAKRLLGVPE